MTSSISKVPLFRWELKDFRSHCNSNKNADIFSDNFNVGPFCFALFYKTSSNGSLSSGSYGVILKDLAGKQLVEASLKLWFVNEQGQMFQENSIEKQVFNKAGDRCQFYLSSSGNDYDLLSKCYYSRKTLYICCKLTDLNEHFYVPITDSTQQLHKDMWSIYEQEVHDAIIKVDGSEFKILKAFFIVQSEVFKNMFTLNFKERETSTVEIKDISEQTMKQLVKWIYTCQIEDKSTIEDLYKVADKYQVNLLKTRCSELMISSLDNSNVFRRFVLAMICNDQQLKDFALSYIDRMSGMEVTAYVTSPAWFELAQNNSAFITEINKLANDKLKM